MMKARLFIYVVMLVCGMSYGAIVFAADDEKSIAFNDIKFDETLWSQVVYDVLGQGSDIIPEETEFDIAPPPANDSEQTKSELDGLEQLARDKRSETVVARAMADHGAAPIMEIFFTAGYFDKVNNSKTYDVMKLADLEMQYFTVKYKKKFLRARPSVLRSELKTLFPNPGHPSYPSGHAGQSWLIGLILSYIDPAHMKEYKNFAKSVGFRREIAGVHYPSDSAAGRSLAEQVFAKLMENKVFVKKIKEAKNSFVVSDLSKAYVVTEFEDAPAK